MTPEDRDRMLELQCDGALFGFTADGRAELEALVGAPLDGRALDLEVAAAAVQLALLGAGDALPSHLAERALSSSTEVLAARGATRVMAEIADAAAPQALARGSLAPLMQPITLPTPSMPAAPQQPGTMGPSSPNPPAALPAPPAQVVALPLRPRRDPVRWLGWLAAAACLALALSAWLRGSAPVASTPPAPAELAPAAAREALVARAKDVVRTAWKATDDPSGRGVSGDVVWSASEQRGFMRFQGLAPNDRTAIVYQLWIFDAERDERYPVDGGVFDVDASTGDVIVPITPRVRVNKSKLFAVTIEKPGGVVVSKRERVVVTAAVPG